MTRRLFLTGPDGVGKSSLLAACLGPRLAEAGGYVTRMELGPAGELTGFTLAPAAAAAGIVGFSEERFLDCTRFPPSHDNEVFRRTAVRLLREADFYPFALLDELGGFELTVPEYSEALYALLRSDLPLIGALKTEEEGEALCAALGLGEKTLQKVRRLHRWLEQDEQTRIVTMETPENEAARKAVSAWAAAWLN